MQRTSESVAPLPSKWNFDSEYRLLMVCLCVAFPSVVEQSIASEFWMLAAVVCLQRTHVISPKCQSDRLKSGLTMLCCDNLKSLFDNLMLLLLSRSQVSFSFFCLIALMIKVHIIRINEARKYTLIN